MAINILVFTEVQEGGEFKKSTREALGAARRMVEAEGSGEVSALVVSDKTADFSPALAAFGADKVLCARRPEFSHYSPGGYASAAVAAAEMVKPAAILVPGTALGRDLTPRLSARLGAPAATDCVAIEAAGGKITALRPAYTGKVQCVSAS